MLVLAVATRRMGVTLPRHIRIAGDILLRIRYCSIDMIACGRLCSNEDDVALKEHGDGPETNQ